MGRRCHLQEPGYNREAKEGVCERFVADGIPQYVSFKVKFPLSALIRRTTEKFLHRYIR